jgi:7,8-dihydroneopterin aldolase/epimerase/oxygenase
MTLAIELAGIELWGFHGVLPEERRDGQRFFVDLSLEYAAERVIETDGIADAVDYRDVVAVVRDVSDGHAYNLLEAFAAAVGAALLERFALAAVTVRVRKPDVVLDAPVEHAGVVVERRVG